MPIELHVPDLPPLTLGTEPHPRLHRPWPARVRDALASYLPLLLMALLALSTWWLVKNAPEAEAPREAAAPVHEPDYTMERFTLQHFGPDGRMQVQIEGAQLRHYPDTDTVEVDAVRIRSTDEQGVLTLATARRAIVTGDATEVQLVGGAHVTSEVDGRPIEFRGEFLHAFLDTERLRSHLPVVVKHGASEVRAGGLEYDHATRTLELKGRVRGVFPPGAGRRG